MSDKIDKTLFKNPKTKISQGKLNNRVMRNRSKAKQLRKALNKLDPRFDDMVKIMWRTSPLRMKDLKAKLKKEREEKKRQKSK